MKKMSPLALAFIASLFIILSQFILSDEWVSVIKNPLGLFRSALPDFEYAVVRVGGIVLTYSILFLFIYLGQKKNKVVQNKTGMGAYGCIYYFCCFGECIALVDHPIMGRGITRIDKLL